MNLSNALKNILVSRLIDANGGNAEAFRKYSEYADGIIINWDLFPTYNDGIYFDCTVSSFKYDARSRKQYAEQARVN